MPNITTIVNEPKRGCGYRKNGGIYLRTDGISHPCGRLPLLLTTCPCCNAGIKQARGWTWIGAKALFKGHDCSRPLRNLCACPLGDGLMPERAGLVWIGEQYYKSPNDWQYEAMLLGVSRRVPALPLGFKIGETLVLVAHPAYQKDVKCSCAVTAEPHKDCSLCKGAGKYDKAAIFHAFTPTRVEYVVAGNETEEELERLEKRGITLVKLVRTGEDK